MYHRYLAIMCLFGFVSLSSLSAADRLWTSSDGKKQVRGEILGINEKQVILRKTTDQKIHFVPFSMLSKTDQEFVRQKFPQNFPVPDNKPADTDIDKHPVPAEPGMSNKAKSFQTGEADSTYFSWQRVSEVFPQFKPLLVNQAAAIGSRLPIISQYKQFDMQRSTEQIGCILLYLSDQDALKALALKLEQKGSEGAFDSVTGKERERLTECYWLVEHLYENFYPKQEFLEYFELHKSKINEFDKGIQLAEYVKRLDKDFQKLKYSDQTIPLTRFISATAGRYHESSGEYEINIRGALVRETLGGRFRRIDTVFLNPVEKPSGIHLSPTEARTFAQQIEGKELVIKQDLHLTRPRFDQNPRISLEDNIRLITVNTVGLSLVYAESPDQVLYKWDIELSDEPNPPTSTAIDSKSEDGLAGKMQTLARQHRLNVSGGYPIIRIDEKTAYQKKHPGSDPLRFSMLLDRVALGLDPDYLNPGMIALHFPETIGKYVSARTDGRGAVNSADWKGGNEFEKRANQEAFNKNYAEKVRDYAVTLPIRFVEVYAVPLGLNGRYDFERKGVFLDHERYHRRFPGLTTGQLVPKAKIIEQLVRPSFVQEFVPIEPQQAQSLFSGAVEGDHDAYVSRIVTWDRIKLNEPNEYKLPPVLVSRDAYQLYKDPMLKQSWTALDSKQIPPCFLSEAEGVKMPGPEHPLDLDPYSLHFLREELDANSIDNEQLQKLFDQFRFNKKSLASEISSSIHSLSLIEQEYSQYGIARNGFQAGSNEEKEETIRLWKESQEQVKQDFSNPHSSFFPNGISQRDLHPEAVSSLIEQWKKWMKGSLESSERNFVVHAEVQVDPQVGDVQLAISGKPTISPYKWTPLTPLIDQGIPANRLVVLNYPDPYLLQTPLPCLQLDDSIEAILQQIPDGIRDQIIDRLNGTARLEMVIDVSETSLLPADKPGNPPGLLLKAEVKGVRLFNDQLLLHEYHQKAGNNNSNPNNSASVSASKTDINSFKQFAVSGQPELLTPATSLRLLSQTLPEFSRKNSVVFMFNRWVQEQDFRSKGNLSVYGINSERGMYFRAQTVRPNLQQLEAEVVPFMNWLKQPENQLGSRFTIRYSPDFTDYNEKVGGYLPKPLNSGGVDAAMNYTKILQAVNSAILRQKRALGLNTPQQSQSGGGSGLQIQPEPVKSKPNGNSANANIEAQNKLEQWTKMKLHLETAPALFYLHHIGKSLWIEQSARGAPGLWNQR